MTPPPTTRRSTSPSKPWRRPPLMRSSPGCASARPSSWVPALDGWLVLRRDLALHVMGDADDVHRRRPALLHRAGRRPEHAHARRRRARAPPRAVRAARSACSAVRERFTDARRRRGRPADRRHRAARARPSCGARFAGPLAAAVVTHSLGLPEADAGAVLRWYDAIVAAVTEVTAGGAVPAAGPRGVRRAAAPPSSPALDRGPGSSLARRAAGRRRPRARGRSISNAAVMLFGGIETTEGMIANAVVHLLSSPAQLALVDGRPRAAAQRDRGVAAARAGRGDGRPVRDGRRRAGRRRDPRAATSSASRSPRPTATRPRSPTPTASTCAARTRASTWPSRAARTSASGCTSRAWRRTPPSAACWSACPGCASIRRARRRPPAWSSASRPSCTSSGPRRETEVQGPSAQLGVVLKLMRDPDSWLGVEVRHLAALDAIARERSFSRAARTLGYTQSAVSQQVALLERIVGARLVERSSGPRPVSLTPGRRPHGPPRPPGGRPARGGPRRPRGVDGRQRGRAARRDLPQRRGQDPAARRRPSLGRAARRERRAGRDAGRGPAAAPRRARRARRQLHALPAGRRPLRRGRAAARPLPPARRRGLAAGRRRPAADDGRRGRRSTSSPTTACAT